MNFTVEDISSVKKKVVFEIPVPQATQALDEAYGDLKKTASVKGFRPGKVPRTVLERRYGKEIHQDAGGKLIQQTWPDFVKQSGLVILGTPDISPGDFNESGAFAYAAVVEVAPAIATIDFKDLSLTKKVYRISDAQITKQLEAQQKFLAEKKPLAEKRPVQSGDLVLLDYEGFKDGAPFSAAPPQTNDTLRVGSGRILPDFDHQLTGMLPGETRTITVTFPDEYSKLELAGLQIDYQVTLHDILEEILPPIDDALAQKLGQFKTLDELKKAIHDDLQMRVDQRSRQELNEDIFKALLTRTDFEVPEILITIEQENIVRDISRMFEMQNMSMEQRGVTLQQFADRYREVAEKQARRHLILNRLIEQEQLTLSDEILEQELVKISQSNQKPLAEIRAFFKEHPDRLDGLKQTLLEAQALQLVVTSNTIKEVETDALAEE